MFGGDNLNYLLTDETMTKFEAAYERARPFIIQEVWEKAATVLGCDPRFWRKDQCEAWININEYGNRQSHWGWEIDHIIPVSQGGSDHPSNLRPLHWHNNASRQAGHLTCPITSYGLINVPTQTFLHFRAW